MESTRPRGAKATVDEVTGGVANRSGPLFQTRIPELARDRSSLSFEKPPYAATCARIRDMGFEPVVASSAAGHPTTLRELRACLEAERRRYEAEDAHVSGEHLLRRVIAGIDLLMPENGSQTVSRWLRASEVAGILPLSERTVRQYAKAGLFRGARQAGRGIWMIPAESVTNFEYPSRNTARQGSMVHSHTRLNEWEAHYGTTKTAQTGRPVSERPPLLGGLPPVRRRRWKAGSPGRSG